MTSSGAAAFKLWALGAVVEDVDHEVAFVEAVGGRLVQDDTRNYGTGSDVRLALVEWGGNLLHLSPAKIFEDGLTVKPPPGLWHYVFEVPDLASSRALVLDAGATEIHPAAHIEAAYGERKVGFFQSPGGVIFELIQILRDEVQLGE